MGKINRTPLLKLKKRSRLRSYLVQNTKTYLAETSLHALKYVGDSTITWFERVYFFISFVLAVFVAWNLGVEIYFKWDSTPLIISMEPETTPINSIPFPAITICNMNQAKNSQVTGIPNGTLDYAMLQKLCYQRLNYSVYSHLKPKSPDDTFDNFILRNAQTCNEMLLHCSFAKIVLNCSEFFREILRDEGLCCVFNAVHPFFLYKGVFTFVRDYTSTRGRIPVDWNPEQGYLATLPESYYPRKAIGPGVENGLSVVLNADIEQYHCSSTNSAGFKVVNYDFYSIYAIQQSQLPVSFQVLLHNPIDTPQIKETGIPLMIGAQSRLSIGITSFKALPSIRSMLPNNRQCLFDSEITLRYFKYYTRRNCEIECDTIFLIERCNCVPYNMPRLDGNAKTCHVQNFDCVTAAENDIDNNENFACKQNCLDGCFELQFLPDVNVLPFAEQNYYLYDEFFHNLSKTYMKENLAQVHFFFNDNEFRARVKTTYTAFTEFLSQTGGILSLMLGFSFISITEVLYYSILKPFFDFILKRAPCSIIVEVNSAAMLPKATTLLRTRGEIINTPLK